MLKVGITGISGLLGWHTHAYLHSYAEFEIIGASRETFAEKEKLNNFVSCCDVIIHFAGLNRGDDQEVIKINVGLVDDLIKACQGSNSKPHIIFSSSTHIYRDTTYGQSKLICTQKFQEWAKKSGAIFTNLILPNVFGEKGKPFHNSAVSTFCYQIAKGMETRIIKDIELELIHAQDVAVEVYKIIKKIQHGEVRLSGNLIIVSDLMKRLQDLARIYHNQEIPDLREKFNLQLFNTYRSYLYPEYEPVKLVLHRDNRGNLFEAIKSNNSGQVFISSTKPGITRGNHYHASKVERFLVIKGKALISMRKLFSDEIMKFEVDGLMPQYVDIPTFHVHNITNIGKDELVTLFWTNEIFNFDNPDSFNEKV